MSRAQELQEQAARLFALALLARGRGDAGYADILTERAGCLLDEAALILSQQEVPPAAAPDAPTQPAQQQQQQVQPKKEDDKE